MQKTKQQDLSPTCTECPHRGVIRNKIIKIKNKEIRIGEFVGQEFDMEKMDARRINK